MIETTLTFLLALALILLAQFAQQNRGLQWLVTIILALMAGLISLLGAIILIAPQLLARADSPLDNARAAGPALLITGVLMLLPVLAAMIFEARGQQPIWRGIPWTRPVQLTAWALLMLFIGSNFALAGAQDLSQIDVENPLGLLLIQNASFALAALLGVGWGVRRHGREALQRLGLRPLSLTDVLVGSGMAILMLISTGILGGLLTLLFGVDLDAAAGFNDQIIAQLPGVAGVLLMGVASGIGEEMLYRGALQPVAGLWITSALFALSHIQYLSPALLIIFVLGLFLGVVRDKFGLTAAIFTHAMYNSLVGLLALLAMNISQPPPGA